MKLPQLSLRELFLLVVIAAMGCGWWVDRQLFNVEKLNIQNSWLKTLTVDQQMRQALEDAVAKEGYSIEWDPDPTVVTLNKNSSP